MENQRSTNGSTNSTTQDVFADFDPPSTTDGSYLGRMKKVKATEAHLERKFEEKLVEVKARLKASRCKAGIRIVSGSIQLQATLPPKPGSDKVKPYQQLISLSIPANLDGLRTAEEEANELGRLLARKQFEWNEKYLGYQEKEETIQLTSYYYDKLESAYFASHKKNMMSEHTLMNYKDVIKRHIGLDTLFEKTTLETKIKTLPGWAVGLACTVVQVIIKEFSLDFKIEVKKPKVEKQVRNVPNDKLIVATYKKFDDYASNKRNYNIGHWENDSSWMLFQWCYGMLATYGLRPRELFVNPDIDWWLSDDNVNNTWKVSYNTKTGSREVLPFVPEWVELFNLKNPAFIDKLKFKLVNSDNLIAINNLRKSIARWLINIKAEFKPYDLRHACAIRAHLQGMPIKIAADNLGHTVEMHTDIYQKWITVDVRKTAMDATFTKKSEVDLLRDENTRLTIECERLKIEVERYRLMVENVGQLS